MRTVLGGKSRLSVRKLVKPGRLSPESKSQVRPYFEALRLPSTHAEFRQVPNQMQFAKKAALC